MYIKKVHLLGFGRFDGRVIELSPGLNIVFGSNEAGKTTFVRAIEGVLFGFKRRKENTNLLRLRYRPWDSALPYVAGITIEDNEGREFYIERNFDNDRVKVYLSRDGKLQESGMQLEEILNNTLGIQNGRIFESTLMIRQEEVSRLDDTEINHALMRKITEGDLDVPLKEIFRVLEERIKELDRGMERQAKNPGLLKSLEIEIESLKKMVNSSRQRKEEFLELVKKYRLARERLDTIRDELTAIGPRMRKFEEQQLLQNKIQELEGERSRLQETLREIKTLENEIAAVRQEIELYPGGEEAYNDITYSRLEKYVSQKEDREKEIKRIEEKIKQINEQREQIRQERDSIVHTLATHYMKYSQSKLLEAQRLQTMIRDRQEKLAEKEKEIEKLRRESKSGSSKLKLYGSLALLVASPLCFFFLPEGINYVVSSALFVLGVVGFLAQKNSERAVISEEIIKHMERECATIRSDIERAEKILRSLVGEEGLEEFMRKYQAMLDLEKELASLDKNLASLSPVPYQEEVSRLKGEIAEIDKNIISILATAGCTSREEYRAKYKQYCELRTRLSNLDSKLQLLLKNESPEEMAGRLAALDVEIEQLKIQLEAAGELITAEEYRRLRQKAEELEKEANNLKEESIVLETNIENYKRLVFASQDLWDLENQLQEKEELWQKYHFQLRGLQLVKNILLEAVEEARTRVAPSVQVKIEEIFRQITADRYKGVEIASDNGKSLFPLVLSPEKKDFVQVDFLSTGTRDQLYLSFRLALADFLTRTPHFPLIFDDPFVNFDSSRLANTIEILRKMADEHQIIWLTKEEEVLQRMPDATVVHL
ncbi:MAG: hypothetical protein PWQ91_379 [Eubacteriales bacterium]|nr:hypothetical protein [Eubacteriales bacterium]